MSFVNEALVWFLFVIVAGLLAALFVMLATVVVKECWKFIRRDQPSQPASPPAVQMDPVKWMRAVVVANPDNTHVWGAEEA
jgi:hypothetical protein